MGETLKDRADEAFQAVFSDSPECITRAPGRVNLIGEHTDYNDGFVCPAAIDRWLVFAVRRRSDRVVRVHSVAHEETVSFSVDDSFAREGNWADYTRGVLREFQKMSVGLSGFDAVLVGDVPLGAGLSSSAAYEMALGKAILELNGIDMSGSDLALLGQRAENRFVGVNCGIMDQFVSANARSGHALFLDCRDLSFEHVPLAQEGLRILICNSGVSRGLTDSAYNERRSACEEGVAQLARASGRQIQALRDVTVEMLETHRHTLPEAIFRRCRHVVTEIDRTARAVDLLKGGDIEEFGKLMAESHASLRDDYEVSGKELDLLVEIVMEVPGVSGARMTGAGFGGCTVNLVAEDAVDAVAAAVENRYARTTGLEPAVYVCSAVNGAERVV